MVVNNCLEDLEERMIVEYVEVDSTGREKRGTNEW